MLQIISIHVVKHRGQKGIRLWKPSSSPTGEPPACLRRLFYKYSVVFGRYSGVDVFGFGYLEANDSISDYVCSTSMDPFFCFWIVAILVMSFVVVFRCCLQRCRRSRCWICLSLHLVVVIVFAVMSFCCRSSSDDVLTTGVGLNRVCYLAPLDLNVANVQNVQKCRDRRITNLIAKSNPFGFV